MNTKRTLYVSIFGPPMTGKTTITQLVKKLLDTIGVETQVSWGLEGPPRTDPADFKLKALAEKIKVIITETQQRRVSSDRHESSEDYQVRVYHLTGIGYGVSVSVQGTILRHDFGDLPILKERARAVAARLANEIGVDVIDEIPNEYDYVQPR